MMVSSITVYGQSLEEILLNENPKTLASDAIGSGDAMRGAILFYQPQMACRQCHGLGNNQQVGPNLASLAPAPSDSELVDAVLRPSKSVREGFRSYLVRTDDDQVHQGILVREDEQSIVLRKASVPFEVVTIERNRAEQIRISEQSLMPTGQLNALSSREQFLDLVRYLMEIRDHGLKRALELEQYATQFTQWTLPDYESDVDHRGLIDDWSSASFSRGEAIYMRVCANCHGTHQQPGSLPTSMKFSSGRFKNGMDPYSMYRTLTHGFGMMTPQTWMVPEQKYDVIYYIRKAFLEPHNPSQLFTVDEEYLSGLPAGASRGPAPSAIEPWQQMDYGPNLIATYEVGQDGSNFAYKGNAIRLDQGPGGISRGKSWMVFDLDTLRVAAAWSGEQFIDYRGINFNSQHAVHPHITGPVHFQNLTGPGWADPQTHSFEDVRLSGRDGRHYGPLPREWAQYRGMYYYGNQSIVSYTVGDASILETFTAIEAGAPVFARHLDIGPRDQDLLLQVAQDEVFGIHKFSNLNSSSYPNVGKVVYFESQAASPRDASNGQFFDGRHYFQVNKAADFNLDTSDYTIAARIRTTQDGTIFAQTTDQAEWLPNGKTFFVRDGRLAFDIGWVGAVQSNRKVNDNQWHTVAVSYNAQSQQLRFYVDGKPAGGGKLQPKQSKFNAVLRLGFTADNFPATSPWTGEIEQIEFVQAELSPAAISNLTLKPTGSQHTNSLARWNLHQPSGSDNKYPLQRMSTGKPADDPIRSRPVLAGLAAPSSSDLAPLRWEQRGDRLLLRIPSGSNRIRFTLWHTRLDSGTSPINFLSKVSSIDAAPDLQRLTLGGPPRWPETVTTTVVRGDENDLFAVDTLTYPLNNPWSCRMRLTGHDFYSDGDRAAICDWDGNVWQVSGLRQIDASTETSTQLVWKRIASGLFQPLGLKIIDDVVHLTCRDQLCRLHDLNRDDHIDWVECINNDHQVTDHFHEFAMGLQVDTEGNFYYAKSARHALPAVVPQHGTLLRVSADGARTDILATGFRAANGVCLNEDGTFFVTDQEGHWNPKNRINRVKQGGFYGNMYGYHEVTDSSDDAMELPVCWITNEFDRSPAELLWVDSPRWGKLDNQLLNLSYGYGKAYLVLTEQIDGLMQGGMIELPMKQLPTGAIRGRFNPNDGQLYISGMYSWAGNQQEPGGFFRIRMNDHPMTLPLEMHAVVGGINLKFAEPLDDSVAQRLEQFSIRVWDLHRTKNYGSEHFNERTLVVKEATVDGDTLHLVVPDLKPTWGMSIRYETRLKEGTPISGTIHNTIHRLGY